MKRRAHLLGSRLACRSSPPGLSRLSRIARGRTLDGAGLPLTGPCVGLRRYATDDIKEEDTVAMIKTRLNISAPRQNQTMIKIFQLFREQEARLAHELSLIPVQNPHSIFSNYEISFGEIAVLGFDYDYTLATYTEKLEHLIYELAMQKLLERGYPRELEQKRYDPKFAIRGLHYDLERGNLLKLDFLGKVAVCMFGRTPYSAEKIRDVYNRSTVARDSVLRPLYDFFCLPEACLLADTIQFFVDNKIRFSPGSIYDDVANSVKQLHDSGVLHNAIMADLPAYLQRGEGTKRLLEKLKTAGKQLFLLTNSSFSFVNAGMKIMFGENLDDNEGQWRQLFDAVITSAQKPDFYTTRKPFRRLDLATNRMKWDEVTRLVPGEVYVQGSLEELTKITGWGSSSILYFGDHLGSDIVAPNRQVGWRTGCIIRELEDEVKVQNSKSYRETLARVLDIDKLIRECQDVWANEKEDEEVLQSWRVLRDVYQEELKQHFNVHFGSAFRAKNNSTNFAYTLRRYADLYTSRLENFLTVPLHDNYTFFPKRNFLPHEPRIVRHW